MVTRRPLENMSKRQRRATPMPFALHLLGQVRGMFGTLRVGCLWVLEDSVYHGLPYCDCWPLSRNARLYDGPGPIIAHPPCGPWGNYKSKSLESKEDGIRAMELVHRLGGVVEQPIGSSLFRDHGNWWGQVVTVCDQASYGHQAIKRTALYWIRPEQVRQP